MIVAPHLRQELSYGSPRGPSAADLVFVEPGQILAGLMKAFLNAPAALGDPDQLAERDQGRA